MSKDPTGVSYCIGRYVIDLPSTAEYVGSSDRYASMEVETVPMNELEFRKEVDTFETRLRSSKHESAPSLLISLSGERSVAPVFAYWREEYTTVAVDLAAYRWIKGYRYLIHTDADPDKVEPTVRLVSETIGRLKAFEGIPKVKGFCIKGAIIADNNDGDDESTTVTFRLRDRPDVMIDVSTTLNNESVPEKLLSRKPGVFSALSVLGAAVGSIHNLREGERELNGIPGQEWLLRAPNDHKFQSHLFTWEAQGRANDPLHPQIRIELRSASYGRGLAPGASSLTDEQAMQLWDQVLNSLRVRPSSDVNLTSAITPIVERGSRVLAGEKCPASGWWTCTDASGKTEVNGGRTQYLRAGETVPQAVLILPAGPWQKIRGEQQTYQSANPSGWKLVDRRKAPRVAPSKFVALAEKSASSTSNFRNVDSREETNVPIGSQLASGQACIASGWWECLETGALDGTRWFAKGVIIPPATKAASLSLIDRMKGMPELVRVAANWRLIRFADFDSAPLSEPEKTDVPPSVPTSRSDEGSSEV